MFSAAAAKNACKVDTPNTQKIPATTNGYTGVSHAVGPVSRRMGELNPFPVANAMAMLPVSCSNGTEASALAGISRDCWYAYPTRQTSAAATINHSDVAAAAALHFPKFMRSGPKIRASLKVQDRLYCNPLRRRSVPAGPIIGRRPASQPRIRLQSHAEHFKVLALQIFRRSK